MFPGLTAPGRGYRAAAAVPAANPQAPAPEAVQPARRTGDDGQPRMGCIRRRSRRLVDIGRQRPARHRTDGADESRRRRGVSAVLHPQCVGLAGDSAADVLAAAGAMGARQVLPLRRLARGHGGGRHAVVHDPGRFVGPRRRRRCRRCVTRSHGPRNHHRHDVHGHGHDGAASAARYTSRPFRGDAQVLRLGGARAGVDQHHTVRQRWPWRCCSARR